MVSEKLAVDPTTPVQPLAAPVAPTQTQSQELT